MFELTMWYWFQESVFYFNKDTSQVLETRQLDIGFRRNLCKRLKYAHRVTKYNKYNLLRMQIVNT